MRSPRIHQGGAGFALRLAIELLLADDQFHKNEKESGADEAGDRREQQRIADLRRLAPIDPGRAVAPAHQRVGNSDPNDGADQSMRARCWQAEPPCAKIPDDRCDQHCEDHRKSGIGADLKDQFDRQQRNNSEGDRARRYENPEKIEETRPDHRDGGRERMRVDDGRHGVGRVVKPVDEFETQRDQQSDAEQEERQEAGDRGPRRCDIPVNIVGREEESESHDGEENQDRSDPHRLVEMWPWTFGVLGRDVCRGKGRHRNISLRAQNS